MKNIISVLVIAIFSITMFSCNKQQDNKIQGEWSLVSRPPGEQDTEYYWQFNEGDIYITYLIDGETVRDTCVRQGNYLIKNNVITIAAPVVFCNYITYDGDWAIEVLKSDAMRLRRDAANGTITYEFVKN